MTDLEKLIAVFTELNIEFKIEEYESKQFRHNEFTSHNQSVTIESGMGWAVFYFFNRERVNAIDIADSL